MKTPMHELDERAAILGLWHGWYREYHQAHPEVSAHAYIASREFKQRKADWLVQYAAGKAKLACKDRLHEPVQQETGKPDQTPQPAPAQAQRSRLTQLFDCLTRDSF